MDRGISYNRKEAKDHGEGGTLVGASLCGKRVLIVDDVITAGTAIREAVAMVKAAGGTVAGIVIALDRQEIAPTTASQEAGTPAKRAKTAAGGGRESAVMAVERELRCRVRSVVGIEHLSSYLKGAASTLGEGLAEKVEQYRRDFGVV